MLTDREFELVTQKQIEDVEIGKVLYVRLNKS